MKITAALEEHTLFWKNNYPSDEQICFNHLLL